MNKVKTLWARKGEKGFEVYVKIISNTDRDAFDYAVSQGLKAATSRYAEATEEIDIRTSK